MTSAQKVAKARKKAKARIPKMKVRTRLTKVNRKAPRTLKMKKESASIERQKVKGPNGSKTETVKASKGQSPKRATTDMERQKVEGTKGS